MVDGQNDAFALGVAIAAEETLQRPLRGNKPVAELRPLPAGRQLAELPSLLASLPHLSSTEAAQLADDLATAREELATAEVRDPWAS